MDADYHDNINYQVFYQPAPSRTGPRSYGPQPKPATSTADAVALKVKQEFAAKAKVKLSQKMDVKPVARVKKTA